VKAYFGANPIPVQAPDAFAGTANIGAFFGLGDAISYPWWRLVYFLFSLVVVGLVFAFLQFTTFGMVVRAECAIARRWVCSASTSSAASRSCSPSR